MQAGFYNCVGQVRREFNFIIAGHGKTESRPAS
ncbi:hypothetical protein HCH_00334 [Hahella chejuensis KCTC 2396]|uniref:Uncharacterized protein n=1 Tax=Hahella chejuensis (strain KCTC 2396) TaxID=349521 RepID=Q2SQ28_HAHCH|nr:hypothetical protein HCH_00334 [Hahella chejuensis KCTC 2396]